MTGIELIAAERKRQVKEEGFTAEHDSDHETVDLVAAAYCYTEEAMYGPRGNPRPRYGWPWDDKSWKPKDRKRNLVRAGALIAAALDRLQP